MKLSFCAFILGLCFGSILNLNAQIDTVFICDQGDTGQLNAPSGFYAYQWTPTTGLDNPTIPNPNVTQFRPQLYIAKIITDVLGENLIENPDFEAGNTGFESEYIFVESIFIQGVYGVNESAANLNSVFFDDCPDHTTGDGQMMVIDGSPQTGVTVWCQTVEVFPETDYAFSVWLTSVNPSNPADLQFSINDEPLGTSFRASPRVCEWRQFYATWTAPDTSLAEICIVNRNTNPNGNDFALDDFAFFELESIKYDTTQLLIESLFAAKEELVYFPNAFSPNDDGRNDRFRPFFGKGIRTINRFQIFDRWGKLVHEAREVSPESPQIIWDGYIRQRQAAAGVYTYVAEVLFSDQHTKVYGGEVHLVR